MKKLSTLFMMLVLVSTFVNAQKNVAYVTKQKDFVEAAWPVDNSVIIQLLKTDPNINLTVFLCDGDGNDLTTSAPVDLTSFDAIIAAETFGSGDNVWKVGFPLHIGSLPKPTLYNKLYSFRSGKGLTTGSGASNDVVLVWNLTVDQPGHDIFKGIDVSSGSFQIVKGGAHDTGETGEKAMQYNTGNVLEGVTMLGHPEGITDAVLSFDDFAAGSTIDEVTVPVRVLSFALNYGQLVYKGDDGSGINLTTEGLTMWRNAVYIVAGLDVPSTPAAIVAGISNTKIERLGAFGVQGGIRVPADLNLSIYNISGQQIKNNVNETFVPCKPGIYLLKSEKGFGKVVVPE